MGLGLANLNQFSESHRNLTEAQGALYRRGFSVDLIEVGVIRLRRAEAYLTEAIRISELIAEIEGIKKEEERKWKEKPNVKPGESNGRLRVEVEFRSNLMRFSSEAVVQLQVKISDIKDKNKDREKVSDKYNDHSKFQRSYDPNLFQVPSKVLDLLQRENCEMNVERDKGDYESDRVAFAKFGWPKLRRMLSEQSDALLDDAAAALFHAEKNLSGNTQNSLWWGRLYTLQLRVYSMEIAKNAKTERRTHRTIGLIQRKPIDPIAWLKRTLYKGILATANSWYRQIRIINYFLLIVEKMKSPWSPEDNEELRRELNGVFSAVDAKLSAPPHSDSAKAYADRVRKKYDELFPKVDKVT